MRDILKKLLSRSTSASATHHVVVGVGTETFGVPAARIHEIICLGDLDTMPRLPKGLTGPVRMIGKLIYLVKLQLPFIRTPADFEVTRRTSILVLRAHSAISSKIPVGVVVDRVERILELGEGDVETVATHRKGAWAACTFGFNGQHMPVVLLDVDRLVAPESVPNGTGPVPTAETATSRLRRRVPK